VVGAPHGRFSHGISRGQGLTRPTLVAMACNTLRTTTLYHTSSFIASFSFFLVNTTLFYLVFSPPSPPTHFRHRIISSSNNENISPLAALAQLHSLAYLVPSISAATEPTGSGREDEGKYILLTSLKPDAWLVHVGCPDGRWWKGAWRVSSKLYA
jgi:hypothetical protein